MVAPARVLGEIAATNGQVSKLAFISRTLAGLFSGGALATQGRRWQWFLHLVFGQGQAGNPRSTDVAGRSFKEKLGSAFCILLPPPQ